ncbi:thioredoxin-like 1-2, chloroplastic [Rosa sericea]
MHEKYDWKSVENFGGGGEYVPQVNYEELNAMCHGLHVHVIPFFRFCRGAEGRVCSFGCTIAAKFKDALAKYGTEG